MRALMTQQAPAVLVVDFGSQFSRLIVRRIRNLGVSCQIAPFDRAADAICLEHTRAIILSGGPHSATQGDAPPLDPAILRAGVPILGICYGEMILCQALGGAVRRHGAREFGRARLKIGKPSALYEGVWPVGSQSDVWMSHGDEIVRLPHGFVALCESEGAPFALIEDRARQLYGVQFHPEVAHTPQGERLLENFVCKIASCPQDWKIQSVAQNSVAQIAGQVGTSRVICALSGGVDSAVTALLVHRAIGAQLDCILVDHGLLRSDEAAGIAALFRQHFNIPLQVINAQEKFLGALEDVADPEEKRKIIGRLFIESFEEAARAIHGVRYLAQGTLYTDIIESRSASGGPSVTIKSHHNVGGLPERMGLELIEPLRDLFKDEVRTLGRELGLPESFLKRHPFPGPGLALRCPGAVTRGAIDVLRRADAIFINEIEKAGLYDEIWQAFVVLLPVRSVGVMGDARTYEQACVLRAVTASDGMTAGVYPFSLEFLTNAATRIVNEVHGINRVLYDVTTKPPGTIEWE